MPKALLGIRGGAQSGVQERLRCSMLVQVGSTPFFPSPPPAHPIQLPLGCRVHTAFKLQPAVLLFQHSAGSCFDLLLILYFKKIRNSITAGNNSSQSITQNTNLINIHFDRGPWT